MSEVIVVHKTRLCEGAKCACGMPVRSLSGLNGGVPSMIVQSISKYALKWSFRHLESFAYKSLTLKISGINFKMTC